MTLIILPSISSRPRVPVSSAKKALYTSHIVAGGMVKVEFDIFICRIVLFSLHHLV